MRTLPLLVLALAAAPALAEPTRLDGKAIADALTGNTVHGLWGGTEYWSWFGAGGVTTYVVRGRPPQNGAWRAAAQQYCSTWREGGGESCYELWRDGDTITWVVPETGARYPSTLLPGDQLPR